MRTNWVVVGTDTSRGAKPGRVHVLEKETPGTIMRTVATADSENRATFIATACNAHDDLVAALLTLVDSCTPVTGSTPRTPHPAKVAAARAALAKAGAT